MPQHSTVAQSKWSKHKPATGPLAVGAGEEAGLRGRAGAAMLKAVMPPPAATTRIVVSGPPGESFVHVAHMDYFPR